MNDGWDLMKLTRTTMNDCFYACSLENTFKYAEFSLKLVLF